MKDLKDAVGNFLHIGDYVCYTTRKRSSMGVHVARIISYTEDPDSRYYRHTLKVVSVKQRNRWVRGQEDPIVELSAYKTTIVSNDTLMLMHPYAVIYDYKELINDYIKSSNIRLSRESGCHW